MFKALFSVIINIVATLIQIVLFPINSLISNLLPDLSQQIINVGEGINYLFSGMSWALGLIPSPILVLLGFIISIEIIKHTVYISTHAILKVYLIIQKIKFW